jgi:hypothetical protein
MLFEERLKVMPARYTRRYGMIVVIVVAVWAAVFFGSWYFEGAAMTGPHQYYVPILLPMLFISFRTMRIDVSLTADSLTIKSGMAKRVIHVSDILSARIEIYSETRQLFKYGYNARYKHTKSYIAGDSKRGIWAELVSGRTLMISSERPEEFLSALRSVIGHGIAERATQP